MSNNLILSSCTHYGPDSIMHFLTSYAKHCNGAKLVVFGGQLPSESVYSINKFGGFFIDVSEHYKQVTPFNLRLVLHLRRRGYANWYYRAYRLASLVDRAKFGSSNGLQYHVTGIQALRYVEYLNYLSNVDIQTSVFITDIRDVIFQSSPFDPEISGLELYEEENNIIGECVYNFPWLKRAVGLHEANKYRNRPVLCSGTTAGNIIELRRYLAVMSNYISDSQLPLGPIDQAYHNFVYYSGQLSSINVKVIRNRYGRVQTLGTQDNYEMHDGNITNFDHSIVPVIHQWDRFDALKSWADGYLE